MNVKLKIWMHSLENERKGKKYECIVKKMNVKLKM